MHISPIFLWNPYHPNHPIPIYKPAHGAHDYSVQSLSKKGAGDGGGGDGRIPPGYPSPILHAPRDIISRKGKSLTPMYT